MLIDQKGLNVKLLASMFIYFSVFFSYSGLLLADASISRQSQYVFTVGVDVNSIDFDVYDKGSTSTNGTLTEEFTYAPFVILGSPHKYIGDSNWGMLMEYSFSGFNLNKQFVGDDYVDLGTSVKGYFAFVTPTLFYSFDNKELILNNKGKLIVGMGVGLGYLNATGDIVFTETTSHTHDIRVNGVATAISLFLDYRVGDFLTRVSGDLTTVTKNNFDYDSFAFSLGVSYVFEL